LDESKLFIGTKEIEIEDKFTLILGKFRKDQLIKYFDINLLSILKNLNLIPLETFNTVFKTSVKDFKDVDKSIELISFLKDFNKITKFNCEIITQYYKLVQELIIILRFNILQTKKLSLLEELKISRKYQKSSNLAATTDLLNKLKESIELNKKKLEYFKQDYLLQKNQIEQLNDTILKFNQQIQDLTKQKKHVFSQINKITREMEIASPIETEKKTTTSYSEMIRKLQFEAKELQYQINDNKTKLKMANIKSQEIKPQFQTYENDYQKLLNDIQKDEDRINALQDEVISDIRNSEGNLITDLDDVELKSVRNPNIIHNQINQIDDEINKIQLPNDIFNPKSPSNFSLIKDKFLSLEKKINQNRKIQINLNKNEISRSIDGFRKLKTLIKDLKNLLNQFLLEINLSTNLDLVIDKNSQNFFLTLSFSRNNKEQLDFENLTTPEKIFFVIILYISIKVLNKSETIIFSNIFVPPDYNKRGSIIRTIKKILPHFSADKNLAKFNLIFILSNFELKDRINNIKIIKFDES
jgi:hypothetical protein